MPRLTTLMTLMILIFGAQGTYSQVGLKLSPDAEVTVLTADPGKELYASFGHTAFRIIDPVAKLDRIYNYGTFSFKQPNFYLKFMRGQLDYQLTGYPFSYFLGEYIRENRGVREQVINLTPEQRQGVYDFLEWNRLPENSEYRYDFLNDNCATRIRDVLEKVIGPDLVFKEIIEKPTTYRDIVSSLTEPAPWTGVGINIILGLPTDQLLNTRTAMFQPGFLERAFNYGTFKSNSQSLVKEVRVLYGKKELPPEPKDFWDPSWIFWVVFGMFLLITVIEFFLRKPFFPLMDHLFFFSLGILGLIISALWFLTDHKVVVWNLNILWAIPTHVIFSFFLWKKKPGRFLKSYWTVSSLLSGLLVLFWFVIPQDFDPRLLPLILTSFLRGLSFRKSFPWLK